MDEAIREHLATEVLSTARIEAALDKAIAMLRTTEKMVPDRNRLTQRLRDVERTLANLTETAPKGGAVPAVLDALNRADAERRALVAELAALKTSNRPATGFNGSGVADLRRHLRGYMDDWQALIGGNVTEARGLLELVLQQRIEFTPIVGKGGAPFYELKIPIAFDRLLVSLVPGLEAGVSRVGLASPSGLDEILRHDPCTIIRAA